MTNLQAMEVQENAKLSENHPLALQTRAKMAVKKLNHSEEKIFQITKNIKSK